MTNEIEKQVQRIVAHANFDQLIYANCEECGLVIPVELTLCDACTRLSDEHAPVKLFDDCPNCESDQSNVRCECDGCGLKGCGDCLPAVVCPEDSEDFVRLCVECEPIHFAKGRKGQCRNL